MVATLLLHCFLQTPVRPSVGLTSSQWTRKDYTDSFSGIPLVSYTLTGRFLDPPQHSHLSEPVWITVCQPKPSHNGKNLYDGLLGKSYIEFGSVLHSTVSGLPVVYRLDDGKQKAGFWSSGTDGTAAFLNRDALNTVLYSHYLPHRAGSSSATKKLVLKVDEAYAASIVAEFEIPDPDEMSRICGTTYHKD